MRKKLYLIPGTMCNYKLWSELLPFLDNTCDLVYLNIPQEKNFNEIAELYNNLIEDEKINLIGFSLGGYIASYFSTLYPERINKLFVISNSPCSLPVEEFTQRNAILKNVELNGYHGISRKNIASLLDGENQNEHLIDLILKMGKDLGENVFISQYKHTSKRIDLLNMKNFSFNTYFYYSKNDKLINSQWLNEISNLNPKLSLISTSGSGHLLPLEKPRELAQHIHSWLKL